MSGNVINFPTERARERRTFLADWQVRCRARLSPDVYARAFGGGVARFPTPTREG